MKNDNYKKPTQTKELPKNRTGLWNKSKHSKRLTNQYQKQGIKHLIPLGEDKCTISYNEESETESTIPFRVLGDFFPNKSDLDDYVVVN
jgi:hypothetical protein